MKKEDFSLKTHTNLRQSSKEARLQLCCPRKAVKKFKENKIKGKLLFQLQNSPEGKQMLINSHWGFIHQKHWACNSFQSPSRQNFQMTHYRIFSLVNLISFSCIGKIPEVKETCLFQKPEFWFLSCQFQSVKFEFNSAVPKPVSLLQHVLWVMYQIKREALIKINNKKEKKRENRIFIM